MKKGDRAEYLFFAIVAVICVVVFVYFWQQPNAHVKTADIVGVGFLPLSFLVIITILCIIELFNIFRKGRKESAGGPAKVESVSLWAAFLVSAATIAAGFGIWYFDGVISIMALVLYLLVMGGVRGWRMLAGIPLGSGIVIYVFFVKFLGVYFPNGWFR